MNVHHPDIARLGRELAEVYAAAPRGEKVTALHLFGIVHGTEMLELGTNELQGIAFAAGLTPSFATELRKMAKLSRYVTPVTDENDQGIAILRGEERFQVGRAQGHGGSDSTQTVFERLARPLPSGYIFDRDEANAR